MTPGDASVSFDIDGLPVVLVLPECCIEAMRHLYRLSCILQEGRSDE
ncbi:MAG: hypothetical protein WC277_05620 [Bacilli bacterium]